MRTFIPRLRGFFSPYRYAKLLSISAVLLILFLLTAAFLERHPWASRQVVSSPSNQIQQENQQPGTRAWQMTNVAPYDRKTFRTPGIEGYAWATSVVAGDTLSFSVSTNQPNFTADIYRLGWYQGLGGRLLQTISNIEGTFYPMPSVDPRTDLVEANWPLTFTIKIEPNWVTGIYVVKLIAANGTEGYIPFVVRSIQAAAFVFIHGDNTDQAYNSWGGESLYEYESRGLHRAYKVSFDRPFLDQAGFGYLLYWEYPMIRWLEKNGYDLSYVSSVDIHSNATLLKNHRGILIVGHNEYWSKQMRDNLESAVNSGINLANFAADTLYWQIRYEPSSPKNGSVPNRIIACYKDKTLDPFYGKDNSQVTVSFKDPLLNRPQQTLLGEMSGGYFNWGTSYDWVASDASNWVFAGTGLRNGDRLPGLVGHEYDKVFTNYPVPSRLTILASSPVYDIANRGEVSNATLYTAQSGARVVDIGSIHWSWGLDSFDPTGVHKNFVNRAAQIIAQNILQNFLKTS